MGGYNSSSGGGEMVKVSIIAFNLTVMVYGLYRVFTHRGGWTGMQALGAMAIALILGLAVGGITYAITSRMNG